jgi:hypothetical protein
VIGALLWYSNSACINLCFSELETKEYVDESSLEVNAPKLVKHVKNKSQRHDLGDEQLLHELNQRLKASASDMLWQILRSHDLIEILSFAFRRTLGSWKSQEATCEHIERGLRLAYAEDDFLQTKLYSKIRSWETAHAPFRIFRNLRQQTFGFGPNQ